MKKTNKYKYYKTIQENWGTGWDSVDFYECNSQGSMTAETRALFKENLKAYRENSAAPIRTVITKELDPEYSK